MPITPLIPNGNIDQLLANDGKNGFSNVNVGKGLEYDPVTKELTANGTGQYKGTWNASTNTPTLPNPPTSPDFEAGDYYVVSAAGTQFSINWTVNDKIIATQDGANLIWTKEEAGAVDTVNSVAPDATGNVELNIADIPNLQSNLDAKEPTISNLPYTKGGTGINSLTGQAEKVLKVKSDESGYELVEDGGNITVANNVGLTISSDELSTIYNTTEADDVESVSLGGLPATPASVLKTKTFVELLDEILFPIQNPTYTIPTISLSGSQTGTKEVGEIISQVLTVEAVKNDAGAVTEIEILRGKTQIDVDSSPTGSATTSLPDQFGYADPNNPNLEYSLNYADASYEVVLGANEWKSEINYNAGLPKKTNKGSDDTTTPAIRSVNAPQAAGNDFVSNTITVDGLYPYFYFVSDSDLSASEVATEIANGNAVKVLANASGTITVDFGNETPKYLYLAHIAIDTSKTKWYISELNQGNIGGGSDLFGAILTNNVNSPDSFWSAVSFKIYKSNFATTPAGSIQFKNS
jgi:hypothetical protein